MQNKGLPPEYAQEYDSFEFDEDRIELLNEDTIDASKYR